MAFTEHTNVTSLYLIENSEYQNCFPDNSYEIKIVLTAIPMKYSDHKNVHVSNKTVTI